MKEDYKFSFEVFESSEDLSQADKDLVEAAKKATETAYAPYSNFLVGAAAILQNGQLVSGSNQENASYPVGTCAERVLLGAAGVLHPDIPITTMAISYNNIHGESNRPISPCGMCRQALKEFEDRTKKPIRLILTGKEGKVYVLDAASQLLPLSFGSTDMK
ncbi:MAG: cytidine deaminase [Ferruginibacter sp.]